MPRWTRSHAASSRVSRGEHASPGSLRRLHPLRGKPYLGDSCSSFETPTPHLNRSLCPCHERPYDGSHGRLDDGPDHLRGDAPRGDDLARCRSELVAVCRTVSDAATRSSYKLHVATR